MKKIIIKKESIVKYNKNHNQLQKELYWISRLSEHGFTPRVLRVFTEKKYYAYEMERYEPINYRLFTKKYFSELLNCLDIFHKYNLCYRPFHLNHFFVDKYGGFILIDYDQISDFTNICIDKDITALELSKMEYYIEFNGNKHIINTLELQNLLQIKDVQNLNVSLITGQLIYSILLIELLRKSSIKNQKYNLILRLYNKVRWWQQHIMR